MNILFAGTPLLAAQQLQALLETHHTIVAVYTQPDRPQGRGLKLTPSPVKLLAEQHALVIEQPNSLKSAEAIAKLASYQPDVMIVAAYGLLLPKEVLALPKYGCINIHLSLLPAWRGASPVQSALLNGDAKTGVTMMLMNEGLDTGDILQQIEMPIANDDTTESLLDKLGALAAQHIKQHLDDIIKATPIPQNNQYASHAPKIQKSQACLDWQENAFILDRKIRAYYPWPIAYIMHQNNPIKIYRAKAHSLVHSHTPGTLFKISDESIWIACKENCLEIFEIQFPGKKRIPIKDALHAKHDIFTLGNVLL